MQPIYFFIYFLFFNIHFMHYNLKVGHISHYRLPSYTSTNFLSCFQMTEPPVYMEISREIYLLTIRGRIIIHLRNKNKALPDTFASRCSNWNKLPYAVEICLYCMISMWHIRNCQNVQVFSAAYRGIFGWKWLYMHSGHWNIRHANGESHSEDGSTVCFRNRVGSFRKSFDKIEMFLSTKIATSWF